MWLKWLPWRYILRRIAIKRGFIDPLQVLAQLRGFAQPSEVGEPMELLRAGIAFHARGLINTGAIQHNLDWVWPYWITRQFDPRDDAFIPRAFSITHINLSHRNWTAVGLPDLDSFPIIDPRGLLTPLWDGWSLDAWIITEDGEELLPSQAKAVQQRLDLTDGLAVVTETHRGGLALDSRVQVELQKTGAVCRQELQARSDGRRAWLAVTLRPYNPEGVSFIRNVALSEDHRAWEIDKRHRVEFSAPAERYQFSYYRRGDVRLQLPAPGDITRMTCNVGMATAAALFEIAPNESRRIVVTIPLPQKIESASPPRFTPPPTWPQALAGHAELRIPDARCQFLYDAALRTLVLHAPGEVYAGPYTYKRFWFRDAAFILHALLCAGLTERAARVLTEFPKRQTAGGYFQSQEGEWDSNGEALWIMQRYCELSGQAPKSEQARSVRNGARWIMRKRLSDSLDVAHAGLLPAGFSAEHLGPNDFYYWDDFWSIAGLQAAAKLMEALGETADATEFRREAERLMHAVERSLALTAERRDRAGIPASPYRRMDGGAIGSLAVGYPLQLWDAKEPRVRATAHFLLENCFVDGGFFQDMIHSGINIYLTLHVAQVLLRDGDARAMQLLQNAADLASPTGQWPEAIHPRTRGGCMGDGQHVWAAAEWVMMMRNSFVREEPDRLILASGIWPTWLLGQQTLSYGPAPTAFGNISVRLESNAERIVIHWQGHWRAGEPAIEIRLPGFATRLAANNDSHIIIERNSSL